MSALSNLAALATRRRLDSFPPRSLYPARSSESLGFAGSGGVAQLVRAAES